MSVGDVADSARVPRRAISEVVVRLAGDSGDGIQLTGSQFTSTSALAGNDVATLPDYPAEIRAPAGTLPGVSGFQLQFSSHAILTPGDRPDALVAFNPAALKVNLRDLKRGGLIIANRDAFDEMNLKKAGYPVSPLDDGSLQNYIVHAVDMTRLTREALKGSGLATRDVDRCKNFFALGMLYWLYGRSLDPTVRWIEAKFRQKPELAAANEKVLRAGYNYANTVRIFQTVYEVPPARLAPGLYRNLDGNEAIALALAAIARRSGLQVFLGSYPITPASTVLHACSRLKAFGVTAYQAEDEIAGIGSALGASFAGALGVTSTSGPGLALKAEIAGLAVMVELPLLIIDVQRGGPSTGLPTKTEQADLLMALYGRHGEAPLPVLAAASPADCFWATIEAARIAIKYMTPVILLSEGYLANGSEPFRIPGPDEIPPVPVEHMRNPQRFEGTYVRDEATLARPWIPLGVAGLEHRVGGLEKDDLGRVSYDALNHQRMVGLRAAKVAGIADDIPPASLEEGERGDDLLVVGWGATYGAITQAVREERAHGRKVASLHLRYLNPLPRGLGDLLASFPRVLVPELNMGQLLWLLQARYRVDAIGYSKVQGLPFQVDEIRQRIGEILGTAR
ncbi:MAG: 2-oxoacid:acceptor oxidoreductase subunit alpha [Acidobacteria bacterium]|nr:2-oxoacid:acceptor oxidoreductase subunit alpha [Acidobacteriota bacterium]